MADGTGRDAHAGVKDSVKEYYGRVLSHQRDLKTRTCCLAERLPPLHARLLGNVADEVLERFYGCGSPLPAALEGATVLDLGCGSGRDVYLASQLVGERGRVIGVDMTEEQLAVARRYEQEHVQRFGFGRSNVELRQGYIEDLAGIGLADESVDVVISNCVINLSPEKERVLGEIFRVLKPGGELYFSDVFSDRRVPAHLREDEELYGECLAGAMYVEDFRRALRELGVVDHRVVSRARIDVENPELEKKIGMVRFWSLTVRAFKLPGSLEDICEDYGQVATYLGGVEGEEHAFVLDDHHTFQAGKPELVCGNTAAMLQETRFARWFRVQGDRSVHFGPFDCAPTSATASDDGSTGGACC